MITATFNGGLSFFDGAVWTSENKALAALLNSYVSSADVMTSSPDPEMEIAEFCAKNAGGFITSRDDAAPGRGIPADGVIF